MPSSMVWGPWRPGQIQHLMGWAISSYRPVQVMVSVGLRTPVSRAATAVMGLKVEPGAFRAWVALLYSGLDMSSLSWAK